MALTAITVAPTDTHVGDSTHGFATDIINEHTSAAGVTIDGVLLKDGTSRGGPNFTTAAGDGAIAIPTYDQTIFITKGSAAALTIVDPTATTHDGVTLTIIATTAFAHTISNAAGSGFNVGGAATDVCTLGGAKGDNLILQAYQGKWYVCSKVNGTLG
jgi:hypothetical protein